MRRLLRDCSQALPIGLNRISWKLPKVYPILEAKISPTDWVKSD